MKTSEISSKIDNLIKEKEMVKSQLEKTDDEIISINDKINSRFGKLLLLAIPLFIFGFFLQIFLLISIVVLNIYLNVKEK